MERAGRVIGKLKLAEHGVTDEQLVVSAWAAAVGKTIAPRTRAISLIRTRLVVEVEDAVWQKQLFTLQWQILDNLEKVTGRLIANKIEFKIATQRRGPARAESATPLFDEADAIRNSTLRNIYVAARKKATA